MYLTCVTMNRLHPSTRQALADCCDMHRNVMRLFDATSRAEGCILYRVLEENGEARLYLYSRILPDFSGASWLNHDQNVRQHDMSPFIERVQIGQSYVFDLLTYPCKKVSVGRQNSVRKFLQTEQERRDWLVRQGEKLGFALCAYHEDSPQDIRGKRSTGEIQIRAVHLTGILRVTNASDFAAAYTEGIGPEKAYGLGMLLLKRR